MIQVYADDVLIYEPHVEGYELLDLTVTTGVNKSGTAEIKMPPGHPAYNAFTIFKTIVTIYRRGVLLFRGRVLYPEDDLYGCRTIVCEGERAFFRDVVIPAYLYTTTPEECLLYLLVEHNVRADESKQFVFGEVTVTDANDYIRLESQTPETTSEAIDKLVERCGGYITFSDHESGQRAINWYADLDHESGQAITFGENLLDYTATGANTELATAIYPYGARDEETDVRVNISSVNGGEHYIQDDEAVERYGFIGAVVEWDDVTQPANLLKKAQQYLAVSKLPVTTLELSAVDLSALDADIDTFAVGDWVRVYSAPHGLDAYFMLRERTYHLLQPEQDTVVLGKDLNTLTGAGVAGERNGSAALRKASSNLTQDYNAAINKAVAGLGPAPTTSARVQSGRVGPLGNTAGGSYTDTVVTFPEMFAEGTTPTVVVGFVSSSSAGNFGRCCCSVVPESLTNAGFILRFFNGDSSNRNPEFNWIAVGSTEASTT